MHVWSIDRFQDVKTNAKDDVLKMSVDACLLN